MQRRSYMCSNNSSEGIAMVATGASGGGGAHHGGGGGGGETKEIEQKLRRANKCYREKLLSYDQ